MSDVLLVKVIYKHICLRCGYEWETDVERPSKCSYCSSPLWDRPKILNNAIKKILAKDMYSDNYCECGCGEKIKKGKRFYKWHSVRVYSPAKMGLKLKSNKKGLTYEQYYGEDKAKEVKQKLVNDRKGKTFEEIFGEEKALILLEGRKQNWLLNNPNDKYKGMTMEQRYGKERAREIKEKMSYASSHPSDETRLKKSIASKKMWQDPEFVKRIFKCRNAKPNKTERSLSYLIRHSVPNTFRYNGDGRLGITIEGHIPDFVDKKGKRIIELFGEYFHEKSEFETLPKLYEKYGYKTLIIWSQEMYRGLQRREVIKRKVKNFVNSEGYYTRNGRYYFNVS
jgi:DNA-directed RNA polymerase subunit RPC12/RpoP